MGNELIRAAIKSARKTVTDSSKTFGVENFVDVISTKIGQKFFLEVFMLFPLEIKYLDRHKSSYKFCLFIEGFLGLKNLQPKPIVP